MERPLTLGLLAGAVPLFLLWGAHQLRVPGPLVNLRVSARPVVLLLDSVAVVVMIVTVLSMGSALAYSAMPALIMSAVPDTESAAANSLNTLMRTIGTSVCSAGTGGLPAAFTMPVAGRTLPSAAAYTRSFGVSVLCAAIAASLVAWLVVIWRRRTPRPDAVGPDLTRPGLYR
ncbi:hypothetical protein [Actinomadura sp. SCN-SB]|uniref:hypothetical protein n=1 Tax=Actinomadura sp. SCN-SB TaxID=3373092 RepID=UPI00375223E2